MNRFLLLALTAGLLSPIAAKADLGEADLASPNNMLSNKVFEAWCGKEKKDCKVNFLDGRLKVNDSKGIKSDEVTAILKKFHCFRTRGCKDWDGTDAPTQNLHKEYFLKYKSQGKEKIAQFTFLQNHAATQFHNDLELWSGLSVKLVGPQNENGSLENVKKQAQLNSAVNLL